MSIRHPLDTMSDERYEDLERNHLTAKLTPEEITSGYRFCCEWDLLLIHGSHEEAKACFCLRDWRIAQGFEVPEMPKPNDDDASPSSVVANDFLG